GGIIPQHPQRFEFVKTQNDETVNEAALRFLINDKRITTSLVGLSNKEQLAEAVKAVDGFKPINDQGVSKIRDGVKEAFNELCTGCRYCDKCPEGIEVPKLMGAYNYYALSGEPMDMIKHLQNHWWLKLDEDDLSSRCTQCRECEKACTQKIDICRRLEEMESHISKYLENPG
ncbi:MAG: 4Fe-4S dicluster domain-containing protein, partial [Planctomycetota bacterium]